MKALSIQQPWAWAILHGKNIENRTWPTHYTGQFLIHAGKKFDHFGYNWLLENSDFLPLKDPIPFKDNYPMGGFVGKSNIINCVDYHPSSFFFGPWGFVLKDSEAINFIPYKGQLGFFDVPNELIESVLHRTKSRC